MSIFSFTASGQFTQVNITTGKDYFRDFLSRQVVNHTITISTLRTDNSTWSPLPNPSFMTTCSGYSGNIWVATSTPSNPINTIQITPTTIGNRSDFLNGVSASDLPEITKYLGGLRAFNSWHMVAADVDNNNTITNNDKTVIQNLVLAITNNFGTYGRNSWSWVPNLDLADFINYPFYNVYGDSGTPSITFSGLSRNQITNASANYFKLHSIKNGDIISPGSGLGHNSWICGSGGYSLNSEIVDSRTNVSELQNVKIEKGDKIEVEVVLNSIPDTLGSMQFALKIPNDLSEFGKIEFQNDFNPKWHYNKDLGSLIVLTYYDVIGEYPKYNVGDILKIELIAKKDCNINDIIGWFENFNEVTNFSGESFEVDFNLEIRNIIKSKLDIKVSNLSNMAFVINSPRNSNVVINISDITGKILENTNIRLVEGQNDYFSKMNLETGVYIFTLLEDGQAPKSIKFLNKDKALELFRESNYVLPGYIFKFTAHGLYISSCLFYSNYHLYFYPI